MVLARVYGLKNVKSGEMVREFDFGIRGGVLKKKKDKCRQFSLLLSFMNQCFNLMYFGVWE